MRILRHLDLPPVYLLLVGAGMSLLDSAVPLVRFSNGDALSVAGSVIALAGLVPAILAAWRMWRARTTIHPHHQPSALVTGGIFALSRNPIYVTDLLLLEGWALHLGSLSPWIGLPVFMIVVTWRFIRPEEDRLRETFGDAYTAYCQRVRRWI
ncbi:MAG: isoprenylcysteine carboxylmethyltransferase family protein [Geminicoccaceae bacterium]|nr:isoprenylcysteine carboxylmethyltransferase family protein [Geminicoccaceae bacterium]